MKLNFYTITTPILVIGIITVIILVVTQKNKDVCENINKKPCMEFIDKNK